MNKNNLLTLSTIFALTLVGNMSMGFSTNDGLVVSNIGSSGDDGYENTGGDFNSDGTVDPGDFQGDAVPPWIKTSMSYWVDGHTSDTEFLSAVEFLANEKIIRVAEPTSTAGGFDTEMVSLDAHEESANTGTWDTEMISMSLSQSDSFFDIFYQTYTVDSFFDIIYQLEESADSFFDVFFEVETPRTNECLRGQELVFNERTSSWQCASADNVDSFFDVFFDVATDSSQNTEDIAELERKISELERKIAALETGSTSGNVETEFKVEAGR